MAKQFTEEELEQMEVEQRIKLGEFRIWGHSIFNIDDAMPNDIVMFPGVEGKYISTAPYPQSFVIAKYYETQDMYVVQRLTLTYMFKHAIKTAITSILLTSKFTLYKLGFIKDFPHSDRMSWKDFTPFPNKELRKRYADYNFKNINNRVMKLKIDRLSSEIDVSKMNSEHEDDEEGVGGQDNTWIGNY